MNNKELILQEVNDMIDHFYVKAGDDGGDTPADAYMNAAQRLENFKKTVEKVLTNSENSV